MSKDFEGRRSAERDQKEQSKRGKRRMGVGDRIISLVNYFLDFRLPGNRAGALLSFGPISGLKLKE